MTDRLYLDHNASSLPRPETIAAVRAAMEAGGNASAPHGHGRAAHKFVADAREAVALAMGVCANDLIFTSGGTEALNTVIKSVTVAGNRRLFVSAMDHPATLLAAEISGAAVEIIPANMDGIVDLDWLAEQLAVWEEADGKPFVSLCAANSETGVMQDIGRATDLVRDAGGHILCDAVQAFGKIPMTFQTDYLAVSAHKIGGPQGIGALYVVPDAPFFNLLVGGGQEKHRRAGTLNTPGISGFGAAAEVATGLEHTCTIRDRIEKELKSIEPDLFILGENSPRLPNTSFFAVPDQSSMSLMVALDLLGISISTGMACSSGKVGASRAATAMNVLERTPQGALRLSLGYSSTFKDADRFLNAWKDVRRNAAGLRGAA